MSRRVSITAALNYRLREMALLEKAKSEHLPVQDRAGEGGSDQYTASVCTQEALLLKPLCDQPRR